MEEEGGRKPCNNKVAPFKAGAAFSLCIAAALSSVPKCAGHGQDFPEGNAEPLRVLSAPWSPSRSRQRGNAELPVATAGSHKMAA